MVYIKLEEVLKSKNKSKYWLAKETDIKFQTIMFLARNETTSVRFDTLEKICKALNCSASDIIEFDFEKQ